MFEMQGNPNGAGGGLMLPETIKAEGRLVCKIQYTVASHFGIPMQEMWSERRARAVARPRQIAMYLAKELTGYSLPRLGRMFGYRDHTTVLHACRVVAILCEERSDFRDAVCGLRALLTVEVRGPGGTAPGAGGSGR
jgi:chromosomal replication initiator protein